MKTLKNEPKPSSNSPSSTFSVKKLIHYFHPDDDFREDHTWGEQTSSGSTPGSGKSPGSISKRNQ
jgi:hypothetical protein